jgi:hypothetical protein
MRRLSPLVRRQGMRARAALVMQIDIGREL